MVQEQVKLMLMNLDLSPTQQAHCVEGNSLEILPQMARQGMKFDVLLLDGDHNYYTVSRELQFIEELSHPHTLVVIDDYSGRWAERDLWYSERSGYESVLSATKPVPSDKQGVKAAVDDWLAQHLDWTLMKPIQGEPVIIVRK